MTYSSEDKTVAIVCYLTILGFIIAVIMHTNKKTYIGAYHLRQALGLLSSTMIVWLATRIVAWIPILGGIVTIAIYLATTLFIIIGVLNAISGKNKPLPFIGQISERLFSALF